MSLRPQNASVFAFWALFAATMTVYGVMILWSLPRITQAAGGLVPFDLRPGGYSLDEATAFLAALDEEARAFYLGTQHWLDMIYPALLAATLVWALIWAFHKVPAIIRVGLIIPAIVGAGFDWSENSRVAELLRAEAVTAEMVQAASLATVVKSVATTLAMGLLLAGLAMRGWARWKRGLR